MSTANIDKLGIVGCGYVGTAVASVWRERGAKVCGTTRTARRADELAKIGVDNCQVTLPFAPLGDDPRAELTRHLAACDAVIFCPGPGRDADYDAVFDQGAANVMACLDRDTCRALIFLSSTRVYGQDDGETVTEDDDTGLSDDKGWAIVRAEQRILGGKVPGIVLRLGGIHGPGRRLADRIRAASGKEIRNPHALVNLVHRDDIVDAIGLALQHGHGGVYNVVDDFVETRGELYGRMLEDMALAPYVGYIEDCTEAGRKKITGKHVSNRKIKDTLGWEPRHPRV